jgi:metal-sulfur cluster biosynthetic enzyme
VTVVTLYGRPECHLCDVAREEIRAVVREFPDVEWREVDIERDERLLATYLERIPVVEVDGVIVSELELDRHELTRALHTVEP